MELVFKKYHRQEHDYLLNANTEKIYLIYDPKRNRSQFSKALFQSISHRNFGQSFEKMLIGPIVDGKKITVRALTPDGTEANVDSYTSQVFEAYLKDNGYLSSDSSIIPSDIRESGTVYYYTA